MSTNVQYLILLTLISFLTNLDTVFAQNSKAHKENPITIYVTEFFPNKDSKEQLKERNRLYEKDHPNVKVFSEELMNEYSTTDFFHRNIKRLLSAKNERPTIFSIDVVFLSEFAKSGYLLDLSQYLKEDIVKNSYLTANLNASYYEGKLWGLPFLNDAGAIYYRRDILEKYGLKTPQTWSDLKEIVRIVKSKEPDMNGYLGQFSSYEGLVCNMLEFIWSNDGDIYIKDDSEIVVRNEKSVLEAIQFVADLINVDGVIPHEAVTHTEGHSFKMFADNKAIFMRNWPSGGIAWYKNDTAIGKVGLMTLPIGPSGKKSYMTLGGWIKVVNARTPFPKEAIKVLEHVINYDSQLLGLKTKNDLPTLKGMYQDERLHSEYRMFFDYFLKNQESFRSRPKTLLYSDFSKILQDEFFNAITLKYSPNESLKKIKERTKNMISAYKKVTK